MTSKEISVEEKLGEFTECCICVNVYDDPRILPCIHTFCLKCIERTGSEAKPGEEMPCPICRTKFVVPAAGFSGLKKNFFMENLVEMVMLQKPATKETLCDVCRDNNDEETVCEIPPATMHCLDCKDSLCDRCFRDHKRLKLSRDHQTVPVGRKVQEEECVVRLKSSKCNQHMKEQLKFYCMDCKETLCMMCYVEGHGMHQCSDVEKVADGFRKEIDKDLYEIEGCLDTRLAEKEQLDQYKQEVIQEAEKTQKTIIERGKNLKALIDKHTDQLLEELVLLRQNRLKEIDTKNKELERRRTMLDNFKMYCTEMKSKGSSSDICRVIKDLHDRTDALRQMITTEKVIQNQDKNLHIFFKETDVEGFLSSCLNIVGCVEEKIINEEINPLLPKAVIITAEDASTCIAGLAILDKNIFTVCEKSSEVEVYDWESFVYQRKWELKELIDPFDIASCKRNKCLYILNIKNENDDKLTEVMRVEPNGILVNKWSLGDEWGIRLFIDEDANIIIPACNLYKLNEYSPDGEKIREIKLPTNMGHPIHAIKLANGQFLVSFGDLTADDDSEEEEEEEEQETNVRKEEGEDEENKDEWKGGTEEEKDDTKNGTGADQKEPILLNVAEKGSNKQITEHGICIVDSSGNIKKSFGYAKSSDLSQLNCPIRLAVDKDGQIIVADFLDSRLLLLSHDLAFTTELITEKDGLSYPLSVQLDESNGRLLVAADAWQGNKRKEGRVLFSHFK